MEQYSLRVKDAIERLTRVETSKCEEMQKVYLAIRVLENQKHSELVNQGPVMGEGERRQEFGRQSAFGISQVFDMLGDNYGFTNSCEESFADHVERLKVRFEEKPAYI